MNTIINNESILRKNPVILHHNQDGSFSKTELDPGKMYLTNADGTFTEIDPSKNYLYDNGKVKELV